MAAPRSRSRRRSRPCAAPLRLERVQPDPGGVHAPPRPHRAGGQGRQAAQLQLPAGAAAAAAAAARLRRRRRDPHAQGRRMDGRPCMPTGDALLSGYYLNELLLRLLARDDPHPALFDAYAAAVQVLAGEHGARPPRRPRAARLRAAAAARDRAAAGARRRRRRRWRRWTRGALQPGARGRPGRRPRDGRARQPQRRRMAGAAAHPGRRARRSARRCARLRRRCRPQLKRTSCARCCTTIAA